MIGHEPMRFLWIAANSNARLVESVGDFIRFQIIGMGLGPLATISVSVGSSP